MSSQVALAIPPVPPVDTVLTALADLINEWGREVVDPSVPFADAAGDRRYLRYALQALRETAEANSSLSADKDDFACWHAVRQGLNNAEDAAMMISHKRDPKDEALQWYITYRHAERAREAWTEHQNKAEASQ
jgi:hypothetical protein